MKEIREISMRYYGREQGLVLCLGGWEWTSKFPGKHAYPLVQGQFLCFLLITPPFLIPHGILL